MTPEQKYKILSAIAAVILNGSFKQPFRIGRKQRRAILDANGREVAIFPKGHEKEANDWCEFLNA